MVSFNKKGGFLYVTDKRIIFIDSYFKGKKEESFLFSEIIDVIKLKNKWLYSNKLLYTTREDFNVVIKTKRYEDLFVLLKQSIN